MALNAMLNLWQRFTLSIYNNDINRPTSVPFNMDKVETNIHYTDYKNEIHLQSVITKTKQKIETKFFPHFVKVMTDGRNNTLVKTIF